MMLDELTQAELDRLMAPQRRKKINPQASRDAQKIEQVAKAISNWLLNRGSVVEDLSDTHEMAMLYRSRLENAGVKATRDNVHKLHRLVAQFSGVTLREVHQLSEVRRLVRRFIRENY